ncbi:MAG TPA: DNA polymerase, partial [Chroococcales cyanobacterium]
MKEIAQKANEREENYVQSVKSTSNNGRGDDLSASRPESRSVTAVLVAEPQVKVTGKPEPRVITTEADLVALVDEVCKFPAVAINLEIHGGTAFDGEVVGYAIAWSSGMRLNEEKQLELTADYNSDSWQVHTAYIPLGTVGTTSHLPAELVHEKLRTIIENPNAAMIVHNSKASMNALSVVKGGALNTTFDPMLMSYIVNPDDKHALKDMAERLLGYSTVRTQEQPTSGRKQLTINFGAVDKIANFGADDARMALELGRYYLEKGISDDQKYLLYEMDLPLSAVLAKMEQNGVALDIPYLSAFSEELSADITRLEKEIYEQAGHAFNIASTQQLQKVLFEELGLKSKARTKTGFSTDAAVLEGLRSEHPIIGNILEFRQLSKLRSTYVEALPRQISPIDNRLHGEFNMTVTATGRLSSSNPNLQNIPIKTEAGRRIRRAFIPQSPDSVLIAADYSQIELRLLGHMSGDPTLRDAFEKDQDIHARTAGEIFDVPIEEVTAAQRRVGKTLNFALVYQQGPMATA